MIETERLLLRPLSASDLDDLVALHAEPEVSRFMGTVDRQWLTDRLELDQRDWAERGHGLLAIIDPVTQRFVGRTGLKYWTQFDETEVGWVLRREMWGRGLATEAARGCIKWGFDNLGAAYFTAMIRPDNARSIKVAERLKMTKLRSDVLLDIPVLVYCKPRPPLLSAASGA